MVRLSGAVRAAAWTCHKHMWGPLLAGCLPPQAKCRSLTIGSVLHWLCGILDLEALNIGIDFLLFAIVFSLSLGPEPTEVDANTYLCEFEFVLIRAKAYYHINNIFLFSVMHLFECDPVTLGLIAKSTFRTAYSVC